MIDASAPYRPMVESNLDSSNVAATDSSELPKAIRAIVLNGEIQSFDKKRHIARLIVDELQELGDFCRTADERLYFFERNERRLYDLEENSFGRMLTNLSGLSATEAFHKFALDTLQARQAKQARVRSPSQSPSSPPPLIGTFCKSIFRSPATRTVR